MYVCVTFQQNKTIHFSQIVQISLSEKCKYDRSVCELIPAVQQKTFSQENEDKTVYYDFYSCDSCLF